MVNFANFLVCSDKIIFYLNYSDLKMKPVHAQTNGDGARRVNNRRNVIASTRSFFSRLFFRLSKFCNAEVYDQIDDNDENTRPLIKGSQNGEF